MMRKVLTENSQYAGITGLSTVQTVQNTFSASLQQLLIGKDLTTPNRIIFRKEREMIGIRYIPKLPTVRKVRLPGNFTRTVKLIYQILISGIFPRLKVHSILIQMHRLILIIVINRNSTRSIPIITYLQLIL